MANKPTIEELRAKQEAAIKAIEEMADSDQIPDAEDDQEDEDIEEDLKPPIDPEPDKEDEVIAPESDDDEEEEVIKPDSTESTPDAVKTTPEPTEEELKAEKLRQSSIEAQRLNAEKQQLESSVEDAYLTPEPTEEELKAEYDNWDSLDEGQKKFYTSALHNKIITNKIREIKTTQRSRAEEVANFVKEVDLYSIDPDTLKKYPLLEGKQEKLKEFANNHKRVHMDKDDLVELFLVKTAKAAPPKKTGQMFETGSGGDNKTGQKKNNDGMISLSEANQLMQTNYSLYKQKLREKKIDYSTT